MDRYENGKSIGTFEKVNEPLGRVKEKVDLSEYEIERILSWFYIYYYSY